MFLFIDVGCSILVRKVPFFLVDSIHCKDAKLVNMLRRNIGYLYQQYLLSSKALGMSQKRRQQEHERQRMEKSTVKCCFLDMIWL